MTAGLAQVTTGSGLVATGRAGLSVFSGITVTTTGVSGYIAAPLATNVATATTGYASTLASGEALVASGSSLMTVGTAVVGVGAAFVTGYVLGTAIGCGLGII